MRACATESGGGDGLTDATSNAGRTGASWANAVPASNASDRIVRRRGFMSASQMEKRRDITVCDAAGRFMPSLRPWPSLPQPGKRVYRPDRAVHPVMLEIL